MERDGFIGLVAFAEIIALQHAGYRMSGCQPDEPRRIDLIHPGGIEHHLGLLGLEDLENLVCIGMRVFHHLVAGKGGTRRILAAGITDHAGKITYQEQGMMAEILQMAHLVEQNRMSQVQVGCCRIESRFYPERTPGCELVRELLFEQELVASAPDDFQFLENFAGRH